MAVFACENARHEASFRLRESAIPEVRRLFRCTGRGDADCERSEQPLLRLSAEPGCPVRPAKREGGRRRLADRGLCPGDRTPDRLDPPAAESHRWGARFASARVPKATGPGPSHHRSRSMGQERSRAASYLVARARRGGFWGGLLRASCLSGHQDRRDLLRSGVLSRRDRALHHYRQVDRGTIPRGHRRRGESPFRVGRGVSHPDRRGRARLRRRPRGPAHLPPGVGRSSPCVARTGGGTRLPHRGWRPRATGTGCRC